jgi:hypothetical protein
VTVRRGFSNGRLKGYDIARLVVGMKPAKDVEEDEKSPALRQAVECAGINEAASTREFR